MGRALYVLTLLLGKTNDALENTHILLMRSATRLLDMLPRAQRPGP